MAERDNTHGQAGLQVTNGKVNMEVLNQMIEHTGLPAMDAFDDLVKSVPESREAWSLAMNDMRETESSVGAILTLNEKSKLYALDAVAVFKELGIDEEKRLKAAEAFSLYYLAVHLFDDAVEDKTKLASKFKNGEEGAEEHLGAAMIATFALNLDLCLGRILEDEDPARVKEFLRKTNESLSKQFRYFLVEKNSDLNAEEVLEAKQHKVSGESTAFMVDCLEAVGVDLGEKRDDIRGALFSMGALTQFMDDLRDLGEDEENNNLNLIVAVKKDHEPEDVMPEFARMYLEEEADMLAHLESAGIQNTDLFRSVPWHPFFMKNLVQ